MSLVPYTAGLHRRHRYRNLGIPAPDRPEAITTTANLYAAVS